MNLSVFASFGRRLCPLKDWKIFGSLPFGVFDIWIHMYVLKLINFTLIVIGSYNCQASWLYDRLPLLLDAEWRKDCRVPVVTSDLYGSTVPRSVPYARQFATLAIAVAWCGEKKGRSFTNCYKRSGMKKGLSCTDRYERSARFDRSAQSAICTTICNGWIAVTWCGGKSAICTTICNGWIAVTRCGGVRGWSFTNRYKRSARLDRSARLAIIYATICSARDCSKRSILPVGPWKPTAANGRNNHTTQYTSHLWESRRALRVIQALFSRKFRISNHITAEKWSII